MKNLIIYKNSENKSLEEISRALQIDIEILKKLNPILSENVVILEIESTPEEITEQENQLKQELKRQAHEELLPTDWYVIRFIERGIPIPEKIKTQRQAILDKYTT
jgi:hypothetical protein